jgi:hypothetical protein
MQVRHHLVCAAVNAGEERAALRAGGSYMAGRGEHAAHCTSKRHLSTGDDAPCWSEKDTRLACIARQLCSRYPL